jgi:cytidylate kinase
MVDEQVGKWSQATDIKKKRQEPPGPVITISRQPGCGSHVVAKRIAGELKIDLFDRKIIQSVAESANMSERLVLSLDEKERSILDNWIQYLKTSSWFSTEDYLHYLTKVIGTIWRHGGAVILGRGANLLLPPEETLRVRLVAPLETRVQNVAKKLGISQEKAEKRIVEETSARKTFIKKYFRVDIDDPSNYDLVINVQYLKVDKIVEIIKDSLKYKKLPARRRFDEASNEGN